MRRLAYPLFFALVLSGCECGAPPASPCTSDAECAGRCLDGRCVAAPDGGGGDIDAFVPRPDAGASCAGLTCGDACCDAGERCYLDACLPDLGPCAANDECVSDSYCAEDGTCVPYGVPPDRLRNEECVQDITIEAITPALQCAFTTPPPGDPYPSSVDLRGTPMVVDFDFDDDPATLRPSIVFNTSGGSGGEVLRVIDGATCALQHNVATGIASSSAPALGDLDGDGRAEIVANSGGTVRAFAYDLATASFVERWEGSTCTADGIRTRHSGLGGEGFSVSLHDLDDDGRPEVIGGGSIYDADGCLLASLGTTDFDRMPVVADIDEDGEPEIISSYGVYRFDAASGTIELESYFTRTSTGGGFRFAAVGDFGHFPLDSFSGEDRAEFVVVGEGEVRVQTIEGTAVFTAPLPSGRGGPPTIADFDGDGRAELAAAARTEYSVFDLDCLPGGDPAGCASGRTDGRLWAVTVNEVSSGVTGSSVFDFDADGRAEVIYHDECFLRIFSGTDGEVLYSFPRSSLTWYEMPVVADVDGDFHSEIVVGAHRYSGSCPATDPYRPEVSFMTTSGVYVLRDELDRWAASRPIWNQHAYSVTHVGDRGELPRTRDVAVNWRAAGLNNFRQNTQGDLEALGVADLTSNVRGSTPLGCRDGMATVSANVCNRGRLPLGGGLVVALREGALDGPELCRTTIETPIGTGECVEISCTTTAPETAVDIYVVPDPDDVISECHEANSWGRLENVQCVLLH